MKAIALGLSISFTGILTFKKSEALRDARGRTARPTASWSRPTRRIWRPANFAASATSRLTWSKSAKVLAETRGVSLEEISRQTTENFFRLFSQSAGARKPRHDADADDSRLRLFRRRAASGARLGRAAIPTIPKNRRRRCSLLVEQQSGDGITRVVIDTSPDLREQLIDANVDHLDAVFLTHEHADQTHGIDDLRSVVLHQRRRIPDLFQQVDRQRHHGAVLLLLHLAGRQRLSADPRPAFDRSRREPGHRREGRRGHAYRPSPAARQHSRARLSHRRRRLHARSQRHSARRAGRCWKTSISGSSTGCATRRIPAISAVDDALSWIERFKPKRAVITNMHSDLDYEVLRLEPAGGRDAGL